jgi:transposase
MDQDPIIAVDLEPVRLKTSLLERIDQLSEERRRLLQEMSSIRNQVAARRQLSEIDQELDRLWDERRRELRQRQPMEQEDIALDVAIEDLMGHDAGAL